MKIDTSPAESSESKAAAARPGSATACYAAAFLSVLAAGVCGGLVLYGTLPEAGQFAATCAGTAVLWWALGDIVSYLAKIAARR